MKGLRLLIVILLFGCQNRGSDLIEIPSDATMSQMDLLIQIMEASSEEPENEWLLKQELHYCEQLNWPESCSNTLTKAKEKWGVTEKLIDRVVAYNLKHQNQKQLESILKSAVETRPRLEAKIRIAALNNENTETLIDRYLDHYSDSKATLFILNQYITMNDTINSIEFFEKLNAQDSLHEKLLAYYPILVQMKRFDRALYIINNQLVKGDLNRTLNFDQAVCFYHLNNQDTAKLLLKQNPEPRAIEQLANWYITEQNWDSALVYIDRQLAHNPYNRNLLLAKAETLESKKWITRSLPYYEQVLKLDTTDIEMAERVEIVRRKVAYLRRIKEQKKLPAPINLERKTTTDN